VLGNGPSLKKTLEESLDVLKSTVCVCVNYFVNTEYYTRIKPLVYVLADPMFFCPVADHNTEEMNIKMWHELIEKTTWKMDFIVSSQYRNNDRVCRLRDNKNINVLFFNQLDCSSFRNKKMQFVLFNKNKLAPPAQTVLNTALYMCIFWRYKNIVLIGADTSWHEELKVNQKTNVLFFENKHFYETKGMLLYKDVKKTIPEKTYEYFYNIARALELYWLLREYAEFNSVKVYNASSKSYIDAFERMDI
jgi:hypothetical protein